MAKQKTLPTSIDVENYINSIDHEKRKADGFTILEMMKRITKLEPKMWGSSIIGFGEYHYKYDSGHEGVSARIAFSPRKARQVLYVLTKFEGQDQLLAQLGKYKTGKVCLYINKLEDVDMKVLEKIIKAAWKKAKNL